MNYETRRSLVKEVTDQLAKCVAMSRILSENSMDDLEISISIFFVDLIGYSIGLHWVADLVRKEILSDEAHWQIDFANAIYEKKQRK